MAGLFKQDRGSAREPSRREAKAALEAEARERAKKEGKDPDIAKTEPKAQRNFLRRGITKVSQDWALVCTAHNLLKLYGAWAQA
jgi:hypothetical protein